MDIGRHKVNQNGKQSWEVDKVAYIGNAISSQP